jgi:hypothetical protein
LGGNYLIAAIYDQDGIDNEYTGNILDVVGKTGACYTCLDKYGTDSVRCIKNTFRQRSAIYAQNGIYERDSADYKVMLDKLFQNITSSQRSNATSTNSVVQRTMHGTAAPSTESCNFGDKVINKAPVASGTLSWVCTMAGAPGTWKTFGAIVT